jgi:5-bromo-4-chloroindolyl phosphate hydrolysis protein
MGDDSSLSGVILTSVLTFIIIVLTLVWKIVVGVIDMAKAINARISANEILLSEDMELMIARGL